MCVFSIYLKVLASYKVPYPTKLQVLRSHAKTVDGVNPRCLRFLIGGQQLACFC